MKKLLVLLLLIGTSLGYSQDRFEGRINFKDKETQQIMLAILEDVQYLKIYNVQMIDLLSRMNEVVQQHRIDEWHQGSLSYENSSMINEKKNQADSLESNP